MMHVDPVEASLGLAKAAAAVVYAPDAGNLGDAMDRLNEALQHYELCRLVSPVPVYRPASQIPHDRSPDRNACVAPDKRFRAALATVGWRVQNPAGLADLLISISIDVADLHEIPNDDPAVQLVASKVAAVCGIAINDDQVNDLIHECFRRSKQRNSRSPLTA
jgi:xanthine dehydrogenase iron-sulfur cluster and FAD-binding subunit A